MHSQRRILYIRTAKQVNTWSMQSTSGVLQRAGPSSFKRWQTTSSSSVVWESPQKPWRSKTYSWEGARGKNVFSWLIMYSLTIYSGTGAFELATLHVALSFISYCRMHLMVCMARLSGGSRTILTLTERHVGLYRSAKPRWLHHLRLRRNQKMMMKQFNSIYESSQKSARRRF